jgi:hypothetical protein
MADPDTGADAPPERRHRRNERDRRLLRRIVAGVAGVAVVVAFVLLATDVVRFGGRDTPSVAGTIHARGVDDDPATVTTTAEGKRCRAVSTTDPLRLWVGGDSLAGSLGPALGAIAGATGVAQPYFDSRVSSGLVDPGFFDWPAHASVEMARLDPEVVVFIVGANDSTAVSGDGWKADYAAKVETMMKTLVGPGRTVYWIGAPVLKDEKMDAAVVEVNAVAQEVAKRHAEVQYVDAHRLFAGSDGKFSYDLPDESGKVVTMRAGDGVHLTMDGGAYLARAVYELVDAQCALSAQKVAGVTKPTIETEGSTQVTPSSGSMSSGSGTGSGSSSSSGSGTGSSSGSGSSSSGSGSSSGPSSGSGSSSGGGTVQTSPPAPPPTAPPVTAPPATSPPTAPPSPSIAPPTTSPAAPSTT